MSLVQNKIVTPALPLDGSPGARKVPLAVLVVAVGLLGVSACGLGMLATMARLGQPPGGAQWAALLVVFEGAAGFLGWQIAAHAGRLERAEARAEAAESRFKLTFDQFPFSVQVLRPDGVTRSVNGAWEKLFGATLDDIKDINLLHDAALRAGGVSALLEVALAGELVIIEPTLFNMKSSWPFSSHGPEVSLWLKSTIFPVKDAAGRTSELILIHEDVTEHSAARQARRESEARNSAIVETALDCIISIDEDGHIIEWNPSAQSTFGFSRDQAIGRLLADLIIPGELREVHANGLKRYLETGKGVIIGRKVEVSAVRANGEEFPVELTVTPIKLGERRIFSGFIRDLTGVKAAERALLAAHSELEARVVQRTTDLRAALDELQSNYERLERLESLRDALTGMVVHDLRTPLNSMLFGIQTVTFLGPVSAAQQECLNVFALGCRDSLDVINDLLDIGKMESGVLALHLEPCVAAQVVKEALKRVSMLATIKNLHLAAQVAEDVPRFRADPEKLHRLLGNLLGNAIKFAPSGGTITLGARLSQDATSIHFWVRDNGAGIPPEAFERIFEKFGQAGQPLGPRETSSGLGLSFCKMIVEAHGGQIWVESQPGQGSLFTATFPLNPRELASA